MNDVMSKIKFAVAIAAVVLTWVFAPVMIPILIGFGAVTLLGLAVGAFWSPASLIGRAAWPWGTLAIGLGLAVAAAPPNPWIPGAAPLPVTAYTTDLQYLWCTPRGSVIGATFAALLTIVLYQWMSSAVRRRQVYQRSTVPSIAAALIAQGRYAGYTTVDRATGEVLSGNPEIVHVAPPGTSPAGSPTEPDRRPRVPARPVPVPVHDAWVDYAVDPAHLFGDLQVALVDQNIEYQTPRKCLLRLRPADVPVVDQLLANLRANAG